MTFRKTQTLSAYNKQWGTKYKPSDIVPISRLNWENREHCKYCGRYDEHTWQEHDIELSKGNPVKGEQSGMLGVPGRVHVQKRPYEVGQQELEDYGKYRRQMLVDYDKKYSLEQLREMCRAKGFSVSGDKKTLIGRLI